MLRADRLTPVVADLTRIFDPLRAIGRLDIAEDGEGEFRKRKRLQQDRHRRVQCPAR